MAVICTVFWTSPARERHGPPRQYAFWNCCGFQLQRDRVGLKAALGVDGPLTPASSQASQVWGLIPRVPCAQDQCTSELERGVGIGPESTDQILVFVMTITARRGEARRTRLGYFTNDRSGDTMPRPKSDRRNELKTRVNDRVYTCLLEFMETRGLASESEALAALVEYALFGVAGSDERTRAIIGRGG